MCVTAKRLCASFAEGLSAFHAAVILSGWLKLFKIPNPEVTGFPCLPPSMELRSYFCIGGRGHPSPVLLYSHLMVADIYNFLFFFVTNGLKEQKRTDWVRNVLLHAELLVNKKHFSSF